MTPTVRFTVPHRPAPSPWRVRVSTRWQTVWEKSATILKPAVAIGCGMFLIFAIALVTP